MSQSPHTLLQNLQSNSLHFNPISSSSIPKKPPFPQLLYRNYSIFHHNLSYPLMTRFKTTKSLAWNIKFNSETCPKRRRKVTQILQNQISLSKLKLVLDSDRPFETTLFTSQIKHLPSLDTLEIIFDQKLSCIKKSLKAFNIYLPHLKKLTTLDLTFSASEFPHSAFFEHLFRSIKALKNLASFSLKFMGPLTLPDPYLDIITFHLCKLTQLRSLTFIFVLPRQLTNSSLHSLALALPKLLSLNKIEIKLIGFDFFSHLMKIKSSTILQFFSSFGTLQNLTDITLSFGTSKIQFDTSIDPLSEGLLYLQPSQIKKLKLYLSNFYDALALFSLAQALSRLNSLCDLDLELCPSNQITVESIHQSLFQLQKLPSLSSLSLSFGFLNLPSLLVANVAPVLQSLTALKSLKLNFTDLSQTRDDEIIILSASLAELTSLRYLDISLKKTELITDKSLKSLALSLKELVLLKSFCLNVFYAESIGNEGIEALAEALSGLKKLKTFGLSLHENSYVDKKGMDKLAAALESLPELSKVCLNFGRCKGLNTPNQAFKNLLRVVKNAKNIQEIEMALPSRKYMTEEIQQIRKRKSANMTQFNS